MSSNGKVRSSHRMLSFVLSLIMMISLIPVSVFADEEIKDPTETEGIEETLVTPELESDMIQESEPNQDLEFEIPQKTLESNDTEYKFTTQPKSGSFDPTTMKYHVTWATSFKPEKIKIEWYSEYLEEWYDRETLTSDMATNLSYDIPLNWGEGTYRIRAYYYAGASVTSSSFQVDKNRFKFTTQPKSGSFDPTTMKYHVTWATSFKPEKIEIEWYSEYLNAWYNKVTLTSDMATNLSCDMPLNWGEGTYRIRAYYEKNSYVTSSSFYVDKNGFKFTTQPINGFFDPIDGMCLATWTTSFKPEKIVIEWYSDYLEEWYVIETLTSDMATNLSYAIHRSWGKGSYRIRAYYDSDAYVTSNTFTISEDMPATSGKCGKNGSELTWSYNSHTLTITGNGEMADYSVSTQPWKLLRSQIKKVVLEEGVKSVGAYAFVDHLALSEVHLPSSLTSIRVSGFYNNATLKDVYCNFSEASAGSLGIAGNNEDIKNASWHYAYRDGGKCGAKLNWRLESDNTLVISGSGPMYDREYASDVPWFKYRNDIVAVRMEGGTSVGKYAFGYLSKLESATIPSTVTAMHDYAFSTCSSLKTLTINSTAVNIPAYFCYNCTSLESITIPKGTVRIGSSAFYGCTSLTSVAFPSGSNLSYIENSAFEGCTNLGNISIPSSVISIGNYAFRNCQSFTTLALPSSLTSLGEQAFANCKNITGTIAIPSGVTSIPASCFYNCSSFNKVTFGPNVVHIWNGAFGNCTNLSSVYYDGFRSQWLATTVDSSNSKLTSASFSYLYIYKKLPNSNTTYTVFGYSGRLNISGSDSLTATSPMPWTEYGPYITELDISGSFTSIQAEAFKNFTAVKTLYLPETIKTVGARAFQDCTSLTDVYFGGVTSEWLRVSIGADNEPLEDAEVYCTGTIGGRIPDCDMYWDFNDVDTLTIYFDMDAGYTDMPDFRDDREQPWYEYQSRIKHLIISEGVTYLGDENFSCLNKLEDVVFPSSIERMGSGVFSYCHSLEDVILPDSVESITASTFWSCGNLNSVKLPSNLKTIPASMFYNSGTLNRVYIPSTVTSIEYNAFKNCTDLCDIYFDGTSAQWSKISIASGNDKLNSVNIHFVVPELAINEKNFPDANFRAYIKEKFDTDKSGWLTNTERLAVRSISCSGRSIGSLSGIENFPKLTSLICSNNSLRGELDLRQNLMLLEVYCDNNEELGKIYIDGLADLQILDCHGDLSISSPNLSTNYALRKLDVSNCQISGLNVKSNSALQNLICNDNQLTYLDLSNNLKLKSLVCYSNCLTKLDVTDHSDLTYIDCADNKLTYIKLGNLPNCTVLKCQYNNLISLDIVGCPHLVECVLSEDTNINDGASFIKYILGEDTLFVDKDVVILTEHDGVCLDETNFPDASFREYLSGVEFDKDQNGWLSIQELESVTEIDISFSDVSDLTGLQYFTYLKTLYACVLDNLTELDLSGNPELEYLDCWDTQIEELDLSANRRLTNLDCNNTPLNSLDVSGLTSLKNVDVSGCSLFELDVSDCKLTSLRCNDNPLTALVLGDQPNLQNLCCNGTDLTELDISRCPLLVDLFCNGTSSESGGVVTYANGSYGFQLKLDSAIEVIYEHDGVAITEANFPDDNFRAFVYENFDTDKNGWLSEDEISNVTDIQASSMNISSLKGIEYFTNLEILNINYNELESLDLSKNTALGILECNNNRIQVLDLRANKNLFALYAGGMETLVGLNVTGLTEMKTIAVHDDSLTTLDLSACKIEYLDCSCNPLSSLILGDQPTLNYLACFGTDFVTLDISRCPHLVNTWLNGEHTEYEWGLEVSLAEEGYMEIDSSVSVTLPAFVEITSQPESISGQIGEE
ncbi:MAG: leucine-rich repeat protein, partial [Clostridiales bacterium]|nr:leucine-rich repeat protein [Clostridiales bacterium]